MIEIDYPKSIKLYIPDKVCVIKKHGYNYNDISFNRMIDDAPNNTISIVKNIFTGNFRLGQVQCSSSSFFAFLHFLNNPTGISDLDTADNRFSLNHWALNDLIMSGKVCKEGLITNAEFVAVTYSGHSAMILKDSFVYQELNK